jgi:endonuclease/exonuclease/phosphatase family metal-dependent hydrolase
MHAMSRMARGVATFLSLLVLCGAAAATPATFKIATWNLNWLTLRAQGDPALPDDVRVRRPVDFARLREYANRLNADIVAFQEVDGTDAAARVFDPARYTLITIGETVVQQVGLAVRRPIRVQQNPDVSALDVERGAPHPLRDGLDATVTFPGGDTLRILVVHLKNGCHFDQLRRSRRPQCALLAQQIPPLSGWTAARQEEGVPFMLIGDFNRSMDVPEDMSNALSQAAPLTRVTAGQSDPCWNGDSFIDHIFLGGAARAWLEPGSLRVMTYQTNDRRDRARLSDHCPVSVRIIAP